MSMILSRRFQSEPLSSTAIETIAPNNIAFIPSLESQSATSTAITASNIPTTSSFFSGVGRVENCSFQVFNGEVNINMPAKRRRMVIESDDED